MIINIYLPRSNGSGLYRPSKCLFNFASNRVLRGIDITGSHIVENNVPLIFYFKSLIMYLFTETSKISFLTIFFYL